jgi:hypothetical protein
VLVAVERNGPVRAVSVGSDSMENLFPHIDRFVDKAAYLMTDENRVYWAIGKDYAGHDWVNHSQKEYVRGEAHNNTAESFSAILERAKQGVFHFLSKKHLNRYLHEIGFRWDHRIPDLKVTKNGTKKIIMKPMSVMKLIGSVLSRSSGRELRRSKNGGILRLTTQLT